MNTIEQSIKALEKWRKGKPDVRSWELYSPYQMIKNFTRWEVVAEGADGEDIKAWGHTPRAALDKLCRRLELK